MRKVRENIITLSGNYALFGSDSTDPVDIFNCVEENGQTGQLKVLPGQGVFYDPATNKTIPAGSTVSDYDRVVFGVGFDSNGSGLSDYLRKPFGESIFGCNINAATADTPNCAVPAISDILFKCTYCDEAYSIEIQVFDEQTDNEYPYNTPATYTYTVKPECAGCDECSQDGNCEELACKFVDAINGVRRNKSVKTSFFKPKKIQDPKFYAARLRQFSHDFCISTESPSDCENCTHYTGIAGAAGTGLNADYTTFTNTLDPRTDNAAYANLSLYGQLETVIAQLNKALDGKGEAIPVTPVGSCCDLRIQVNTCIEDLTLTLADGSALAPCDTTLPLAPIANTSYCVSCEDTVPTESVYCGIRLIQKLPQPECNCYPDLPGIRWFSGDLNVYAKDGFTTGGVKTRKVQEATQPSNMGYQWQRREYWADNGGHGRNHEPYISHNGTLGLPLGDERIAGVTADCKKFYCSITLEHGIPNTNNGVSSPSRTARGRTIVLIPIDDNTTITSFQDHINPYITSSGCPVKREVTCNVEYDTGLVDANGDPILTVDQDQLEGTAPGGTYPNQNGRIY